MKIYCLFVSMVGTELLQFRGKFLNRVKNLLLTEIHKKIDISISRQIFLQLLSDSFELKGILNSIGKVHIRVADFETFIEKFAAIGK